jgi:NO-binding membrane sensor protein with MHYT domain
MGLGIWSMHYVGMLAFRLPVPVLYDWPTVLLSLLAAVFAVSGLELPAMSGQRNKSQPQEDQASEKANECYASSTSLFRRNCA